MPSIRELLDEEIKSQSSLPSNTEVSPIRAKLDAILHDPQEVRSLELSEERIAETLKTDEPTIGKSLTRAGLGIGRFGIETARQAGALINAPVPVPTDIIPPLRRGRRRLGRSVQDFADRKSEEYDELSQAVGGGGAGGAAEGITSGALTMIPTVAAAMFGGFPAAITTAGLQSMGSTLDEGTKAYMANEGLSRDAAENKAFLPALASGLTTSAVTALFGRTGIERVTRMSAIKPEFLPAVRQIIRNSARGGIEEGAEEFTDQVMQSLIAYKTFNPNLTFDEAMRNSMIAGLAGTVIGAKANLVFGGVNKATEALADRKENKDFEKLSKENASRVAALLSSPEIAADPRFDRFRAAPVKTDTDPRAAFVGDPMTVQAPPPQPPSDRFIERLQETAVATEPVNSQNVFEISKNVLRNLEGIQNPTPFQLTQIQLLRAITSNPDAPSAAKNLAALLDLRLDESATQMPNRYRTVVSATPSVVTTPTSVTGAPAAPATPAAPQPTVTNEIQTQGQGQEGQSAEGQTQSPRSVIVQSSGEVVSSLSASSGVPVAGTAIAPQPSIQRTGTYGIAFTPLVKEFEEEAEKSGRVREIVFDQNAPNAIATDYNAVGRRRIILNPKKLAADTKGMTTKQRKEFLRRAVAEEVIHNIGSEAMFQDWITDGQRGTFEEYYDYRHELIYREMTDEQRRQVITTYGANPEDHFSIAVEFIRMTIQNRMEGKTTEQVLGNQMVEYLRSLLRRLKEFVNTLKGNQLQQVILDHVIAIEAILQQPTQDLSTEGLASEQGPRMVGARPIEDTMDVLYHGTNRKFDRFERGAPGNAGNRRGVPVERFYFSRDPDAAARVAEAGGFKEVSVDRFESEGEYADTAEAMDALRGELAKAEAAGAKLAYMRDDGSYVWGRANDLDTYEKLDSARVYSPKKKMPRLLKASVKGRTLDLTKPYNQWPDGLRAIVKNPQPLDFYWHDRTPQLYEWAKGNGFSKIEVPDSYESGGKSVIVLPESITSFEEVPSRVFPQDATRYVGTFSPTGRSAIAAEQLAATPVERQIEGLHQLGQGADLSALLEKHGIGSLDASTADRLKYSDYVMMTSAGQRLNGGAYLNYRGMKSYSGMTPVANEFQLNWISRLAATQFLKFQNRSEALIKKRDEELKKMGGPGHLNLLARELAARVRKSTAEATAQVTESILQSAMQMANKALQQEREMDLDIAQLESQLRGIDEASKSPVAMRQLMDDMVRVLSSTPTGLNMLTNPSAGTRADMRRLYVQLKTAAGSPLNPPSVVTWGSYILHKNRKLREQLLAAQFAATSPVRGLMNAYQTKFAADLEKDPVAAIKRSRRVVRQVTTDAERAAFAWHKLNSDLTERLDEFSDLDDAATVAENVLKDPNFKSLRKEIMSDSGHIGTQKPAEPFDDNSILLPDGTTTSIDTRGIHGLKTHFANKRVEWEKAIGTLEAWLSNPSNSEDPNYGTHERNLATLKEYFYGLGALQPNDRKFLWTKSFDILWNAVYQAGGRVAQIVKTSVRKYERMGMQANWWTQRTSHKLTLSRINALKSHGLKWGSFSNMSLIEANELWWRNIGNQLAYSHNRQQGGLRVGELVGSGWTVTQQDLDDLKAASQSISDGFKIAGTDQYLTDDLGGFETYRKGLKTTENQTPRTFETSLVNTLSTPFMIARRAYAEAEKASPKNTAAMAAAEAEMIRILNNHWTLVAYPFVWDRNPDFSTPTPFDGNGGAFQVVAARMEQNPVKDFDALVQELSSLSTTTPDQTRRILLGEWGSIIGRWHGKAAVDTKKDVPRAKETSNPLTKGRNELLAPYVFYKNGFKNTHDVASFGVAIYSRQIDEIVAGLRSVEADINRQMADMAKRRGEVGENKAQSESALARANEENYDNWKDLERRLKLISDVRKLIEDDKSDVDLDITVARHIGALTGALVSGVITTARNVTTGPRYLGQLALRFTGSPLRSYPLSIWYSWIDAQARIIPSLALSTGIGAAKTVRGLGRAIVGLGTSEGRDFGQFLDTTFRDAIQEIGENAYLRIKKVKELVDKGIMFIPPAQREFDARMLGSILTGGRILDKDLSLSTKLLQSPVALVEALVLSFTKAYAPLFGDTAINMATANLLQSSLGPIAQLDTRLRELFIDYQKMGISSFTGRKYSQKEILPTGLSQFRYVATEADMKNLRSAFEMAGLNFDEKASEFLTKLQAGVKDAQFLNDQERLMLVDSSINYVNRASPANTPVNLKALSFLNNLIRPFMPWKTRTLSNFVNFLSVPSETGKTVSSSGQLAKARAGQWAYVMTALILPMLIWGAFTSVGDEEESRALKAALYNQVNATRQPWEREGVGSQAIGWGLAAVTGIPFIDMLATAMMNDLPNRASLAPELAVIEKMKDVARYVGGAIQTGDLTYKLPELVGSILPDTKIVLNRMEGQEGRREANNAVNVIRRKGPVDMLRPTYGEGSGVNVTPVTPLVQAMENAAYRGDTTALVAARDRAVEETMRQKPDLTQEAASKYVSELFSARNPYNRALKGRMTPEIKAAFLARLSPQEASIVSGAESAFATAASAIGARASFEAVPSGGSAGASGGFGAGGGGGGGSFASSRGTGRRGGRLRGSRLRRGGRGRTRTRRIGRLNRSRRGRRRLRLRLA